MRTTKITYACDSCGKSVARPKDLQRVRIHIGRNYKSSVAVQTDLCDDCEPRFLSAVAEFMPDAETPALMEARRDDR